MGQKVIIRFFDGNLDNRLHPETISPLFANLSSLRMFKIVFGASSFFPKQLSLLFPLWLISLRADCIGYITNFCSKIELLYQIHQ